MIPVEEFVDCQPRFFWEQNQNWQLKPRAESRFCDVLQRLRSLTSWNKFNADHSRRLFAATGVIRFVLWLVGTVDCCARSRDSRTTIDSGELGRTRANSSELERTRANSGELGRTRANSGELGRTRANSGAAKNMDESL